MTASLTHPPVRDRAEIFSLLRAHRAEIHDFGVRQIGVFGSFARGEQNAESDADLLIEFEPSQKTFGHFMKLASFLDDLFGRGAELVTTEALSTYIGSHVLREVEYVDLEARARKAFSHRNGPFTNGHELSRVNLKCSLMVANDHS